MHFMRTGFIFAVLLLLSAAVHAVQPFKVKDIRVVGAQRTDAGTVFSYLPVKVGDTLDDEKAAAAIKALYATGFYSDVHLEVENDVLVVRVQERPAIAQIDIDGSKEFTKENLKDGLKQVGLTEAKIFDRSTLDRAEKEIKRQYTSRGFYSAKVTTTVTPLERNRVSLSFKIDEGEVAKITDINIIGATAFKEKELLDQFELSTGGWFSWFTKDDQYSKQKLTGDLEKLRSFYLNRGFLEFNVDTTQVSITPDREKIYITVNITEGPVYTISDVKFNGDLKVPEAEITALLLIKSGDVFSRQKVVDSVKRITDRLGNDGYSFANVNPVPDLDKEKRTAAFTLFVDAGRRVYIRRINIAGNQRTRDEVVRRELRQLESSWYSIEKINRSKERLDRTGFFEDVNVETPAVPGTQDQVDLNVTLKEKNTGQMQFGLGYSNAEKLTISASIAQANIFGSGNQLSLGINSGSVNKTLALSFLDPYWTVDGVARGFDIYRRDIDSTTLAIAPYTSKTEGAGVRFGVPITEYNSVNFGLGYERTKLGLTAAAPQRYIDFVNIFGYTSDTLRGSLGFASDTRDSIFYPTRGGLSEFGVEVGLPGGDLQYYRATFRQQWLRPVYGNIVLALNGELGIADGYGGKPLPFFKNFYAGGVDSVRGFQTSTLGPKDVNGNAVGGAKRIVGNIELLFPMPGMKNDKSVRLSGFVDAGNVFGPNEKLGVRELRTSAGIAVSWYSPVGPLKFSLAKPLKEYPFDKVERFQFLLGRVF
jgi:outer membrane protein insertion porin family